MRAFFWSILIALFMLPKTALAGTGLQTFEADSMSQILASHTGKPFVLLLWSPDCEYCQASLKTLAKEKHKHKELLIVTVATDSMTDPQTVALVQKRLTTLGMNTNAWAFGAAPPEQLHYAIDPKWRGEMPRSYWFDAKGNKVAYSGVLTSALINKLASR